MPAAKIKTVQLATGFTQNESLNMFSNVLKPVNTLPLEATDIHNLCKGNPFIISFIAGNLKGFPNIDDRWRNWKNKLTRYRLTDYKEYVDIIESSTIELNDEYKHLFQSLVIFNDNVNIPLSVMVKDFFFIIFILKILPIYSYCNYIGTKVKTKSNRS